MERGEVDDADAALEHNLKLLRDERDDEAQETSLFAIGNLCFQRMDYPKAARRLEEALEHFPDNAEAVKARYNLALSYQQMGNQKNFNEIIKSYKNQETIDHFVEENRRMLQRAAEEFEKLLPLLDMPEHSEQLPREDLLKIAAQAAQLPQDELVKIPLRAADCRFFAGQYAEALVLFDRIADRCNKLPRTPDRKTGDDLLALCGATGRLAQQVVWQDQMGDYLVALCGSIRCHGLLLGPMNNHRAKLRDRIAEMQWTLKDVDEATQGQWNGWIRDVETELRKANNKGE
jgi:tetratricopeptide (TPR) repeat protein